MANLEKTKPSLIKSRYDHFRKRFRFGGSSSHFRHTIYAILALGIVGALLPKVMNSYVIGSIIFLFMIYAVLGISYDIVGGLMGYINLGHIVFFGIGAYSTAILLADFNISFAIGIPMGALVGAVFALLFSFPFFRLKGFYFAVITLAFAELASLIVSSKLATPATNGFNGITFVQYDVFPAYYAALALTVFSSLVSLAILRSKFGLALISIREDEEVSDAIGVNVNRMKILALILSAAIAGTDGAIYFWGRGSISPDTAFGLGITFIPVTVALLGGTGTIVGALVGAALLIYLDYYLIGYLEVLVPSLQYFPNAIIGIILIIVGLFMPKGIIGSARIRSAFTRILKEFK